MYCLFCVLFLCKCALYYWHRVTTQLQLINIPYINSVHRDIILSDQLHLTSCQLAYGINHSLWVVHSHMEESDEQLAKQNNNSVGLHKHYSAYMTCGPSSDDISPSGSQQILCPVRNSTVHSRVHRSKPLNPVLTLLNPLSTFTPHSHKTRFNITFQYMAVSPI